MAQPELPIRFHEREEQKKYSAELWLRKAFNEWRVDLVVADDYEAALKAVQANHTASVEGQHIDNQMEDKGISEKNAVLEMLAELTKDPCSHVDDLLSFFDHQLDSLHGKEKDILYRQVLALLSIAEAALKSEKLREYFNTELVSTPTKEGV